MTETAKQEKEVVFIETSNIKHGWRARKSIDDIDALAESIKDIGQIQPIVVKESTKDPGKYVVIAGMRRVHACKKLGVKVEAIVVSTKDESEALQMQMVENIQRKQFDDLELGEGLKRMKELYEKAHPDTVHGGTGGGKERGPAPNFVQIASKTLNCSTSTIYRLLNVAELPETEKKKIDEAPTSKERNIQAKKSLKEHRESTSNVKRAEKAAKKEKPSKKSKPEKSKKQELETKVIHGTVESTPPVDAVDLILTDPPADCDEKWVGKAAKQLKSTGQMLVFCDVDLVGYYIARMEAEGMKHRSTILWHVTNTAPDSSKTNGYLDACKAIVWATKSGKYSFTSWRSTTKPEVHAFREGPGCTGKERLGHPDQKPLWLLEELVLRHSEEGQTVLDPFAGVFSVSAACKKHGRNSIGIEKSSKYVSTGKSRLGLK